MELSSATRGLIQLLEPRLGAGWAQEAERRASIYRQNLESPREAPHVTLESLTSTLDIIEKNVIGSPSELNRHDGWHLVAAQVVSEKTSALLDGAAVALAQPMSASERVGKTRYFAQVERAHAGLRAATHGIIGALYVEPQR